MLQSSLQIWKADRNNLFNLLNKITKMNILLNAPFVAKYAKGLLVHLHTCKKKTDNNSTNNDINTSTQEQQRPINNNDGNGDYTQKELQRPTFYWNKVDGNTFTNDLNHAYDNIVFCKKNSFPLPTGAAAKRFIT